MRVVNGQKIKVGWVMLWMTIVYSILSLEGCRLMHRDSSQQLLGDVEISNEQTADARLQPNKAPQIIYVSDFDLDAENFQDDQGVRGMMSESGQQGILGRLEQRLPHPFTGDDPARKAQQIVDAMAQALVDRFVAEGMPAQRLVSTSGALPSEGWLLQGVFTEVGEGDRLQRAIIGFGKGATSMEIQVGVSDLAGDQPRQPFIVFGTIKDPSELPGAVVTMNPYVAAAKFVMQKNATTQDIKQSAAHIVDEILRYKQKIKEAREQ